MMLVGHVKLDFQGRSKCAKQFGMFYSCQKVNSRLQAKNDIRGTVSKLLSEDRDAREEMQLSGTSAMVANIAVL